MISNVDGDDGTTENKSYEPATINKLTWNDKEKKPTKEVEVKKPFAIDEALKESTIVEASENPYYVGADLNALKVC